MAEKITKYLFVFCVYFVLYDLAVGMFFFLRNLKEMDFGKR